MSNARGVKDDSSELAAILVRHVLSSFCSFYFRILVMSSEKNALLFKENLLGKTSALLLPSIVSLLLFSFTCAMSLVMTMALADYEIDNFSFAIRDKLVVFL